MRIKELTIFTQDPQELYQFYRHVLEIPAAFQAEEKYGLKVGNSVLIFEESEEEKNANYYFTIIIPSNKIREAERWLASKVNHVEKGFQAQLFSTNRNVQSILFKDPENNLIELVARHDLYNAAAGPFGSRQFLRMNSLGFPVMLIKPVYDLMRSVCDIELWYGDLNQECAIGDEYGYFHLMEFKTANWLPAELRGQEYSFIMKFEFKERSYQISNTNNCLRIKEI